MRVVSCYGLRAQAEESGRRKPEEYWQTIYLTPGLPWYVLLALLCLHHPKYRPLHNSGPKWASFDLKYLCQEFWIQWWKACSRPCWSAIVTPELWAEDDLSIQPVTSDRGQNIRNKTVHPFGRRHTFKRRSNKSDNFQQPNDWKMGEMDAF